MKHLKIPKRVSWIVLVSRTLQLISKLFYYTYIFTALKEPPFVVKEAGYAGFNIVVEFVFKGLDDKDKVKRTRVDYDLFLIPNLEDLSARNKSTLKKTNSHTCRKIITISHKDPKFIKSLIKGGGNLKSSPKALESSHHKSSTSKSSSGTTSSSSKSKSAQSRSEKICSGNPSSMAESSNSSSFDLILITDLRYLLNLLKSSEKVFCV